MTGINAGSGPEQPETVGKAPRDSAYPTTRTGPKGASSCRGHLPAVARRREAGAGLLGVRVVKFSFSAFQNTIDRTLGPRWRPSVAGRARCVTIVTLLRKRVKCSAMASLQMRLE